MASNLPNGGNMVCFWFWVAGRMGNMAHNLHVMSPEKLLTENSSSFADLKTPLRLSYNIFTAISHCECKVRFNAFNAAILCTSGLPI